LYLALFINTNIPEDKGLYHINQIMHLGPYTQGG